jgi:hypothetical protein
MGLNTCGTIFFGIAFITRVSPALEGGSESDDVAVQPSILE